MQTFGQKDGESTQARDPAGPRTSSLQLWLKVRAGDRLAVEHLFARVMPALRRWASGRLPRWARSGTDTADIVQDALVATLGRLQHFDVRRQKALQAYLRQAIRNRIRDELRRVGRRGPVLPLDEFAPSAVPSPLEEAVEAQAAERYKAGLARLSDEERELVVARLELGYSHGQIALVTGRPSPDAARMAVKRALLRLAEEMAPG